MLRVNRRIASGAVAIVFAALFGTAAVALTLDEAKQNGVRLGFPNEPPNTFIDADGNVTGAHNELAVAVLGRVGVTKVEGVVMDFASLIPGLLADRLDIIPAIFIRPARCEQVIFSEPTQKTGSAVLVAASNPKNLHGYDDLVESDAVVAVMAGAVEYGYAQKAGVPEERIVQLQDQAGLMEGLKVGRVDAVILTPSSVTLMADNSGGAAERAMPFDVPAFASSYGGMAFRPTDTELRDAFNAALKDFIGTPEFMTIMAPLAWDEERLPGAMTTAEQCTTPPA